MTAALTIGPDGVARIEIVIKLDITVKTEEVPRAGSEHGSGDRPGGEAPAGIVGVAGSGGEGDSAGVAADDRAGTDDPPAPADGMGASPVDVAPEPVAPEPAPAPLPPADEEPQPAAEAGGEPTIEAPVSKWHVRDGVEVFGPVADAKPTKRVKSQHRKTASDGLDQPSQREIAIAAYERGATFFEAGREPGVSRASVANWVRESGAPVRLGAWKLPPEHHPYTAARKPAGQAAPKAGPAPEPAHPAMSPPAPPKPAPLTGDEVAIAEIIATGLVTHAPGTSGFCDGVELLGGRIRFEAEADDDTQPATEHVAADDPPALVQPNPGGDHEIAPAPTAADATGMYGMGGDGGGAPPTVETEHPAPEPRRSRRAAERPRKSAPPAPPQPRMQRPPPVLPTKAGRELSPAEVAAAAAAGRFQRLPAIDERLGSVPLIETVEHAKAELERLGHKVRVVSRNAFKVGAREFNRPSFLAFARSTVRMDAARKRGLVA